MSANLRSQIYRHNVQAPVPAWYAVNVATRILKGTSAQDSA